MTTTLTLLKTLRIVAAGSLLWPNGTMPIFELRSSSNDNRFRLAYKRVNSAIVASANAIAM
jgi:hypothetical protein